MGMMYQYELFAKSILPDSMCNSRNKWAKQDKSSGLFDFDDVSKQT